MISVLILTLNEEVNLPGCLKSLDWCDDIHVLDSGSTDTTVELATEAKATCHFRAFDHYSAHRNWALDNINFKHDWVYSMDADERMPEDLREELHQVIQSSAPDAPVAYRLRYKNMFMGRWIKHATLYPSWLIRLFRHNKIRYEDRKVNAHPIVDGSIGSLEAHFEHYSFNKGITHWIEKHNRYSSFEAEAALDLRDAAPLKLKELFSSDPLIRRRVQKNIFFRLPFRPSIKFLYMYILRRGFLDGFPGLTYCILLAFYEHMIVSKTWELERFGHTPGSVPEDGRVLLLNQYFPPDTAATGQLLKDLAVALTEKGLDVHVVCSAARYDGTTSHAPPPDLPGLTTHRINASNFGRSSNIGRLIDYWSFERATWKAIRAQPRFDLCISMTTPPYLGRIGARLKKRNGTRHLLWVMDLYPHIMVAVGQITKDTAIHRALMKQTRSLLDDCSHIVACGAEMADEIRSLTTTATSEVPNWAPSEGQADSPTSPPDGATMTLMYSGNPGRGHDLQPLLNALTHPDLAERVTMLIACADERRSSLLKTMTDAQKARVRFLPLAPVETLKTHLQQAHLHLITQRSGTGTSILPSKLYGVLDAGRPILYIGPDSSDASSVIRKADCGYTFLPGASNDIVNTLKACLEQPERLQKMGRNAKSYYEQHLGRTRSIETLLELSCQPESKT